MKNKDMSEKELLRKSPEDLKVFIFEVMQSLSCLEKILKEIAENHVNSSLSGVEFHGI